MGGKPVHTHPPPARSFHSRVGKETNRKCCHFPTLSSLLPFMHHLGKLSIVLGYSFFLTQREIKRTRDSMWGVRSSFSHTDCLSVDRFFLLFTQGIVPLFPIADCVMCRGFIVEKGLLFSHVCLLCLDDVMSYYLIIEPWLLSSLIACSYEHLCGVGCVFLHTLEQL